MIHESSCGYHDSVYNISQQSIHPTVVEIFHYKKNMSSYLIVALKEKPSSLLLSLLSSH